MQKPHNMLERIKILSRRLNVASSFFKRRIFPNIIGRRIPFFFFPCDGKASFYLELKLWREEEPAPGSGRNDHLREGVPRSALSCFEKNRKLKSHLFGSLFGKFPGDLFRRNAFLFLEGDEPLLLVIGLQGNGL